MKKLLLPILLAAAIHTQAQTTQKEPSLAELQQQIDAMNSDMSRAGESLKSYSGVYYTGFGISAVGGALTLVGISHINDNNNTSALNNKKDNQWKSFAYLGGGLTFVGMLVSLVAHGYIHTAGVHLVGDQVRIDLDHKKK